MKPSPAPSRRAESLYKVLNLLGRPFTRHQRRTEDENRYSAILAIAPNGILSIDERGIIRSANKVLLQIFGYTEEELIGQPLNILVPPESRSQHKADSMNYVRQGQNRMMWGGREIMGVRKDGSRVPVEVGLGRAVLNDGTVQVVASVQDISMRKQQDELRQQLMSKLLQSNTELERFAYIASHDMQEPIRMVTNFSRIIASDYSHLLDATGKEYFKIIIDAGARMKDMVEDLLTYSRIEQGDAEMLAFDGQKTMESVMENLQWLIAERGAEVTADPMPMLYGNSMQIMRLLQNLITNGIKYQPRGNTPRLHVGIADHGGSYVISVTDNGLGISPEFQQQVFQPFRRLHTWDKIPGTGLGLSICRKIAENHGGEITLVSEPGKGSTFSFSLPKPLDGTQEAA